MFYSQIGQDRFIYEEFFPNKRNGTFLDIGAYDGATFSNTLFFEKELDWSGVCVEPNPEIFWELRKNRSCTCLNFALSSAHLLKKFVLLEDVTNGAMLSGFPGCFSPTHRESISNSKWREINVLTSTLDRVCDMTGLTEIDFCSIDTEGSELQILKGWNPEKHKIEVLTIEDNDNDPRLIEVMTEKGYEHVKTLQWDKVFKRKKK